MKQYEIQIIVLFAMLFCHIVDDYYLQGFLSQAKQRIWWIQNYPHNKYSNDYIMALLEHAFSWTFMISLPAAIYLVISEKDLTILFIAFLTNWIIHAFVDNLKANALVINLIQDQLLHIIQVITTWWFVIMR